MAVKSPYLLSGLVQCSHCGFNYSGYTRGGKGLSYYADSGFINKGKSVCQWHAIPKNHLENFVISAIRERLGDSRVPRRVEAMIEEYLDRRRNSGDTSQEGVLEKQLQDNQAKLGNLLNAIECGVSNTTVIQRIKEIEAENSRLDLELRRLKQLTVSQEMIRDAASQAAFFLQNFEKNIARASILDRKLMMKRVVQGITVNRADDYVECRLRRVPIIENPILKTAFQNRAVQSRVRPEPEHRSTCNIGSEVPVRVSA